MNKIEIQAHFLTKARELCVLLNPQGAIEYANDAFYRLTHTPKSTGESCVRFIHQEDHDNWQAFIGTKQVGETCATRLRGRSHKTHHVISWQILEYDKEECLWLSGINITRMEHSRRAVDRRLKRLEMIVEQAAESITVHDLEGRIIDINTTACTNLGYTREELLMMTISDIELDLKRHTKDSVWANLQPNTPITVEGTHKRKDDSSFPVEVRISKFISDDDEPIIIALARDMTTRKFAEEHLKVLNDRLQLAHGQAVEASQAKSTFLAHMSHELRTPLNAIIGYAEMLLESFADEQIESPELHQDTETILSAAQHLLDLINDILSYSKLESGTMELVLGDVQLQGLIEGCIATIKPMALKQHNVIHTHIMYPSITLHADAIKVRQVLYNLLSNAVKFTQNGTINIHVNMRTGPQHKQGVDIIIKDTGEGIASEDQEGLFEPFIQAYSTVKNARGGTGLGLAISRTLSRLMGGDLSLESTPGVGSTFRLWLPIRTKEHETKLPVVDYSQTHEIKLPTAIILDLDEHSAKSTITAFERLAFRISLTTRAQDLIALARAKTNAKIIINIQCHEGKTALHQLASDPSLAHKCTALFFHDGDDLCTLDVAHVLPMPIQDNLLQHTLQKVAPNKEHGHAVIRTLQPPKSLKLLQALARSSWTANVQATTASVDTADVIFVESDFIMEDTAPQHICVLLHERPQAHNTHTVYSGGLVRRGSAEDFVAWVARLDED